MPFRRFVKPLSRLLGGPDADPHARTERAAPGPAGAAGGGGEEATREAAVRALPDGEALRTLAGLAGASAGEAAAVERIAQERVAQLIDSGTIDFDGICAASSNAAAVLAVAGHCGDPARLPQALARFDDLQWIATLVIDGSSSRLRQLAAQRIDDPAALKQLLKQARDRDKNVYKIIKQKCDALREVERHDAQVRDDILAACASLERHAHRVYDPIYEPTFRHFHERWQSLEERAAPEISDRARLAVDRCREIMASHARLLAEQAAQASRRAELQEARKKAAEQTEAENRRRIETAAAEAAQAARVREAEEQARAEARAAELLAQRRIGGLAARALSALRDGHTGQAAGLRRAIEEKLPRLAAVPGHLAAQVHELDAKLDELKQWKDYAVAPKRAELIAEMESLIGSSEPPQVLADRINQLKEDWRTISKGVISESEADWQRFHTASVAAYQPCREYFEAQSKLRRENLERRKSLLERLQAFEAGQSGDGFDSRLAATVLREARQEWRRNAPVDRAAGLAVAKEFDASMARLQERLDAWHAELAAAKQALIQRARQLVDLVDVRGALDAMKGLQQQWKQTGALPRDQEQRLWEEFRGECDAIYRRRQQAQADRDAGLEANKSQALALCLEVEQLAALAGPALLEGTAKIAAWRSAFDALGELPRAEQRAIRDRFEAAVKQCQSRAAQQRATQHEAAFAALLEAARRIQHYGWAVAQNVAPADREPLRAEAESFIAGILTLPKGADAALKEAWGKAEAAAGIDLAAQERALRMLCVRGEILAERPTPPEDQAMRREHQVRRLVERMGQGGAAGSDDRDALALEWVRTGPAAAAAHESQLARFRRCR